MLFDNWKFIFYSKLAQLNRTNKLYFEISLNKYFPNIYEIRNTYLRNYIKSIKLEFYMLSNIKLFIWHSLMQICFNIFFYKKVNIKYIIIYILITLMVILILIVIFYVFFIKKYITYTNIVTNILPLFTIVSNKLLQNIFTYLILIGL